MNGTDITNEDGKLVKTLYMRMSEFIIQNDGIMRGVDNPDIFPMIMDQDHVYNILIETFDFRIRGVSNETYTITSDLIDNKHRCFDVHINDYSVYINVDETTGDYNILRLMASGTNPDVYRTIRIIDITNENHLTQHAERPDNKLVKSCTFSADHPRGISRDEKSQMMYALLRKSLPSDIDIWSSKPSEPTTETADGKKESTSTHTSNSEEAPTKEETTMKPEMKEKMEHARKVCTYVINHVYGTVIKADMCLVHSNYNLALKTGHEYLAHAKFYNNGQVAKEDICEFKNIKLYPDATINFTLKIDGSKNKINIDINPGTKDYSILDIIEECEGLDATIDVYDCTPQEECEGLDATIDVYDCTPQTEEDSKETTSDKDEKPNFTSEVDPQLRDKEFQATLMAELFKQRFAALGLSVVNKDESTVDIDECLSADVPWKTFQTTGVHYMHDGSLDVYGIYSVSDEGIEDLNDRIRKMICDIKDAERLVKRIRTENEALIDKLEELKTTTTYPHILDVSNHCINTADDIMVRVELREKTSHTVYTVGTLYSRKDDQYGYRMIFGEDGQYEMKVIDADFVKEHPMIPGLHSLYIDTDQIPKQMRENLEMVVSELVDRHIHPYSKDFIECLNVIHGWLREAHKNLKGTKRARKQIIKALKD